MAADDSDPDGWALRFWTFPANVNWAQIDDAFTRRKATKLKSEIPFGFHATPMKLNMDTLKKLGMKKKRGKVMKLGINDLMSAK